MKSNTNYNAALATLVTVFFFWGFIAASNGVFIPFCKSYFHLDQFYIDKFERILYLIDFGVPVEGIYADFSKQRITDAVLSALINLAEETDVRSAAVAMAEGAIVNTSEGRPAAHIAIRRDPPALNEAFDTEVGTSFERMAAISDAMRQGSWQGVTGQAITDVINIGIGGSDLGPKMACAALREFADGPRCHFIANVDGAEINGLLRELQPATTVVIISSKTFTTQHE